MLEGMAPAQARGGARRAPATCCSTRRSCDDADFAAAIAYLVRRLDENTAPENFLRAAVRPRARLGARATTKRDRFAPRCATGTPPVDRAAVAAGPRAPSRAASIADAPFANEPDTDWTPRGEPGVDRRRTLAASRSRPPASRPTVAADDVDRRRRRAWPTVRRRRVRGDRRPRARERRAACSTAVGRVVRGATAGAIHRDDGARGGQDGGRGRPRGVGGDRHGALLRRGATSASTTLAAARRRTARHGGRRAAVELPVRDPGQRRARRARRRQRRDPQAGAGDGRAPRALLADLLLGRRRPARRRCSSSPCRRRRGRPPPHHPRRRRRGRPHRRVRHRADVPRLEAATCGCTPRRAARTRSSSPRPPTSTSRCATSSAPRSGTPARSARPRASRSSRRSLLRRPGASSTGSPTPCAALRVGPADDLATMSGRSSTPAGERAAGARSRTLDPGEPWLVEPEQLDRRPAGSGRPACGSACARVRGSTAPSASGPVLGVIRADDLDHAIAAPERHRLRAHRRAAALDPDEIAHWPERVEVGNVYVNRASPARSCGASRSAAGSTRSSARPPRPAARTTSPRSSAGTTQASTCAMVAARLPAMDARHRSPRARRRPASLPNATCSATDRCPARCWCDADRT